MTTTEHAEPRLVELRVHGINNASAASVLECAEGDVVREIGDEVAGFFHRRTDAGAAGPAVQREAYSWGGLARTGGYWSRVPVLAAVERFGWALLVPFGLANIAYWSRPLDNGTTGRGATSVRLFGLGLTVLLVTTLCTIGMDLYALQCHPDGGSSCRLDLGLGAQPAGWRVALLSAVPMLALAGLWRLTHKTRARYEEFPADADADTDTEAGADAQEKNGRPVLARAQLWEGGVMVRGLSYLHTAAGSAVVVLASAWPALFGPGAACRTLDDLGGPLCAAQAGAVPVLQRGVFGSIAVLATVILAAAVVLVAARTTDAPDVKAPARGWTRPATKLVLIAAVLLYAVQVVALVVLQPALTEAGTASLPGSNAGPTLVVAILTGIAASGMAWRSGRKYLPELCGAMLAVGLLALHVRPLLGAALVLGAVFGLGWLARRRPSGDLALRPLRRTAPGVLLGLSLLSALVLCALVVLTAGDWLDRRSSASDLLYCAPSGPPGLCVPRAYVWAATTATIAVGLLVLLVVALLLLAFARRMPGDPAAPEILRARRWAALAHRAEPVVGVIGFLGLLAAATTVAGAVVPPDRWRLPAAPVAVAATLADWSAYLLTTAALAIAAVVVTRTVLSGRSTRPLGLLWDLLCFLPRAAHPFAPPCYAERAVPELADRVRTHLGGQREVVLSAHSLGAVLAVAAYYRLRATDRRRVRLLTYGAQLRPYFGRLFPDLFGPHVLGTQPCPGAELWSADPWAGDTAAAAPAELGTLRSELGQGWVSLWRPTDHLGFPVCAYPDNGTDVRAEELLDGRAQAHSDYPRTAAYATALEQLPPPRPTDPPDVSRRSATGAGVRPDRGTRP